jgi:hypothetical protein
MVRKMFCAMVVMFLGIGFVAAAELNGVITKVDGNKITFQEMTKAKKGAKSEKVGDAKVFTVAKDAKIVGSKFDKDAKKTVEGDEIKGGLTNEMFTKIGEAGVNATITYEGDTVSKILVRGGKKKAAE